MKKQLIFLSLVLGFLSICTMNANSQTEGIAQKKKIQFVLSGKMNENYVQKAKPIPFLAKMLNETNECRTGAINENGNGIFVKGKNSYTHSEITSDFNNLLKSLNTNGQLIKDVYLNNNNQWCVVWDKNSYQSSFQSDTFHKRMKEIQNKGEEIISIAFNDNKEWIILTNTGYAYSGVKQYEFLQKAIKLYGKAISVSITNDAMLVCCERGVFYENVPTKVVEVIQQLPGIPRIVKFTDSGTCLVTDGKSQCTFWL